MAYVLSGSNIRRPTAFNEQNSTQLAENRTLQGDVTRDYFGDNKRVWVLSYRNVNPSDFTTINNIYQTYLSSGTVVTWQVTEASYTVSSTSVHIDLIERGFSVKGSTYLSDFDVVLKEA